MDDFTRAFLPVVEDPARVALLYGHLREFCHDIRNRLGEYRIAAYIARRGCDNARSQAVLRRFDVRFEALLRFIDDVQLICRPMVPRRTKVALGGLLEEAHRDWEAELSRRERPLQWSAPQRLPEASLDTLLLGDALENFVAWRSRVGTPGTAVRSRWYAERDRIGMVWEEPACRSEPETSTLPCLAPVVLARTLQAHGGSIRLDDREGFRLEIVLPIAPDLDITATERAGLGTVAGHRPSARVREGRDALIGGHSLAGWHAR